MRCGKCKGKMVEIVGSHGGVSYAAFKCAKCGDELMNMQQAKKYMKIAEEARMVTFSKWGEAIAVRIPAELVKKFGISNRERGKLIEEKDGFRIIPAPL
jgi:hypothetical protein